MKGGLVRSLLELNLGILFISTSGVFGRYIDLPSVSSNALRSIFAVIILFAFCKWRGFSIKIKKEDRKTILIGGVLLGIHWVTYFQALKYSNIAIAMLSLYTFPAITTILEPLILKTKLLGFHMLLSIVALCGLYLLVPDFSTANDYMIAVGYGVLSALAYALRNILMKSKVDQYNGTVLMVVQLVVVSIFLLPFFIMADHEHLITYLPMTVLLGLFTTVIGHTLFLNSFKSFSTSTASIISCLTPVYGIILGIIFLKEYPALMTLVGGAIIVSTVFVESYRIYKK